MEEMNNNMPLGEQVEAVMPPPVAPPPAAHVPAPHPAPRSSSAFPSFYKKVSFGFLALGLLGLGLVIYAVMSSAKVVIMAKPEGINKEFAVDISTKPGPMDALGFAATAADTITRQFPVTTDASVKQLGRAMVHVKIESAMSTPQTLIEKTRLVTPTGVQFRLTKAVTVPARGSVEADALADDAGEKGQVGLASFTIPGLRPETRQLFTVTALTAPVAPEENVSVGDTGIPDGDAQAAAAVLKDELSKRLTESLRAAAVAAGVKDGAELLDFTVAAPAFVRNPGDPQFTATLKVTASGVFYDRASLQAAVRELLKRELPAEHEVRSLGDDNLTVTVAKAEPAAGTATLRVRVNAEASLTAAAPALAKTKLVGIKREAALQYLQAIEGVNSADIVIHPVWATRLPSVASRIELEVR